MKTYELGEVLLHTGSGDTHDGFARKADDPDGWVYSTVRIPGPDRLSRVCRMQVGERGEILALEDLKSLKILTEPGYVPADPRMILSEYAVLYA